MNNDLSFAKKLLLSIALLSTSPNLPAAAELQLLPGIGQLSIQHRQDRQRHTLTAWYFRPDNFTPESRIVFVMHGMDRNADDYLDDWIESAEQHGWLIIAPKFNKEAFGGSKYRLGNMLNQHGRQQPQTQWAYRLVDRLFDHVRKGTGTNRRHYTLFGHSAGAQFVHRMVLFHEDARIELAIAANAGFYTMPHFSANFPFGLAKIRFPEHRLWAAFQTPLFVLVGENDVQPNAHSTSSQLGRQGIHRLARGKNFMKAAQASAAEMGCTLQWDFEIVTNVGHDHTMMASAASDVIVRCTERTTIR